MRYVYLILWIVLMEFAWIATMWLWARSISAEDVDSDEVVFAVGWRRWLEVGYVFYHFPAVALLTSTNPKGLSASMFGIVLLNLIIYVTVGSFTMYFRSMAAFFLSLMGTSLVCNLGLSAFRNKTD